MSQNGVTTEYEVVRTEDLIAQGVSPFDVIMIPKGAGSPAMKADGLAVVLIVDRPTCTLIADLLPQYEHLADHTAIRLSAYDRDLAARTGERREDWMPSPSGRGHFAILAYRSLGIGCPAGFLRTATWLESGLLHPGLIIQMKPGAGYPVAVSLISEAIARVEEARVVTMSGRVLSRATTTDRFAITGEIAPE